MDNKKFNLNKIKVKSFVTSFSDRKAQTIKGGIETAGECHTEFENCGENTGAQWGCDGSGRCPTAAVGTACETQAGNCATDDEMLC